MSGEKGDDIASTIKQPRRDLFLLLWDQCPELVLWPCPNAGRRSEVFLWWTRSKSWDHWLQMPQPPTGIPHPKCLWPHPHPEALGWLAQGQSSRVHLPQVCSIPTGLSSHVRDPTQIPYSQNGTEQCAPSHRQPWLLLAVSVRPWALDGQAQVGRSSARVKDCLRGFTLTWGVAMPWKAGNLSHATCRDMLGFVVPSGLCSSSNFPTIFTLVEFHFLWFPVIRKLGCGRQRSLKEPKGVALMCFILVFIFLTQDQPAVED